MRKSESYKEIRLEDGQKRGFHGGLHDQAQRDISFYGRSGVYKTE